MQTSAIETAFRRGAFALLMAVFCLFPTHVRATDPAKVYDCVVCHPNRDKLIFDLMREKGLGVEQGNVSGKEFVCWSCHNGSVLDSRRFLTQGGQHPVGMAYTGAAPKNLMLYTGSKMECGTCHSPHGKHASAERWLRLPANSDAQCTSCHDKGTHLHANLKLDKDRAKRLADHGGMLDEKGQMGCRACHTPHGARGKSLLIEPREKSDDNPGLCNICHATKKPVHMGDKGNLDCVACHDVHTQVKLGFIGGAKGPCADCHKDAKAPGNHKATSNTCAECHSIHSHVEPKGLLKAYDVGGNLCVMCHADRMGRHGLKGAVSPEVAKILEKKGFRKVNPSGKLDCNTCHAMHKAPKPVLMRNDKEIGCLYCHPAQNPLYPESGDHPVGVGMSGAQQKALLAVRPDLKADQPHQTLQSLTCLACHDVHDPVDRSSATCEACHQRNAGAKAHGPNRGCLFCHPTHGDKSPIELCTQCHKTGDTLHTGREVVSDVPLPLYTKKGKLTGKGKIGCITCHDPHAKTGPILRFDRNEKVCVTCHPNKLEMSKNVHFGRKGPDGDGCLPCHAPHAKQDLKEMLATKDAVAEVCYKCHKKEDHLPLEAHTYRGMPPWKQMTGKLPLFGSVGKREEMGFMTCATCHNIHSGGEGSFRLPKGNPPTLCLTCHAEKAGIMGSKHDPAQKGSSKICTSCHQTHSKGDQPPAWNLKIRGRGTWNDRKCLSCHYDSGGSEPVYTMPNSHPVNLVVPKNRTLGVLPLFDALGRPGGQRVTCSTCHDIHGVVAQGGGINKNFLRQDPKSGELCRECHLNKAAVIGTPHDLREDPEATLGPCGPCHVTHNARLDHALIGFEPAEGKYFLNNLCRPCHNVESRDINKPPLMQYHMKDAEPALTPRGTNYLQFPMPIVDDLKFKGSGSVIPIFDENGEKAVFGVIQCLSCHNPHQWSPVGATIKPGQSVADFIPLHFTNVVNTQALDSSVCKACHAKELDRVYKGYHKPWEPE